MKLSYTIEYHDSLSYYIKHTLYWTFTHLKRIPHEYYMPSFHLFSRICEPIALFKLYFHIRAFRLAKLLTLSWFNVCQQLNTSPWKLFCGFISSQFASLLNTHKTALYTCILQGADLG